MADARGVIALLLALAVPAAVGGREPTQLTLRPAAAAEPALRYRVLPALVDQGPGNAVEFYQPAVGPFYLCPLLGGAVATFMTKELELFLTQEQAPNLYWALTDLPRPFLDLRKPLEGHRYATYACFPGLLDVARGLNAGPMNAEQLR